MHLTTILADSVYDTGLPWIMKKISSTEKFFFYLWLNLKQTVKPYKNDWAYTKDEGIEQIKSDLSCYLVHIQDTFYHCFGNQVPVYLSMSYYIGELWYAVCQCHMGGGGE